MRAGAQKMLAARGTRKSRVQRIVRGTRFEFTPHERGNHMNIIIYIVGLVVVIIAVLSFFGLR